MDLAFLAVPEAAAAELAPPLVEAGVRVIDLSGAFRIRDAAARSQVVSGDEALPNGAAYGLTEFYKNDVRHASLIANPGCYPTAALLALMPLAQAGLPRHGRRHRHRRQVRNLGRGPRAERPHAFLARTTARSPRTASSAIATSPRWNRSLGRA